MNPEAEEAKKKGNECMKEDKFIEAMLHYTKAVKLEPDNPTFYSNRSLAFLKIQQHNYAWEDANTVTKLMPKWTKGYFRKGEVEFATEHYREALESYQAALELDPGDTNIQKAHAKASAAYKIQKKTESRVPWYGVALGLFIGILIVLADQALTKKPVMQNEIIQGFLVFGIIAVCYAGALAYRYLMISNRTSMLEAPMDMFPDDLMSPGMPGAPVSTARKPSSKSAPNKSHGNPSSGARPQSASARPQSASARQRRKPTKS